ncbi:PLP-dependent aminotransferase family protein (plasmid) [Thioclava litoralis]|uniref:PLP-dependent aminotransferase family protein n=1 Tax=Thioclava litoralis TaxID=3076557 RepID=A0ABZ1E3A3_9RHOB|nr:PLP-dependent aminotransferase family protein [Thioclava sp. FTW29]
MANSGKSYQSNLDSALFALLLDPAAAESLQAQLLDGLRRKILSSNAFCGVRLPASRVLAAELSVSRTTVQIVYDQLISEGYLVTRQGAGTFVAQELPHLSRVASVPRHPPAPVARWRPFQSALPDPALMPHAQWARHLDRAWRAPSADLLARPDPLGWYPLRAAIADHLLAWRQLACDPQQVVITSGARDAFEIIFRALLPPTTTVAIEDPCWPKMARTLMSCGARAHPVRIGPEGLDPAQIPARARAAIVTPSRHYPTGRSMPLSSRLALLEWAGRSGGVVIEDDYDSEFRYRGQPLPALAGLDRLENVLYLGSFSKLLSAALRIGYMVVPQRMLPQIAAYFDAVGGQTSLTPQPALASFMESGEFALHLRRMRRVYARRQAYLLSAMAPAQGFVELAPDAGGMHLCAGLGPKLQGRVSDREISAEAARAGLCVAALSDHCSLPHGPEALLLGYAGFDEDTLGDAARRLCALLARMG